jgi:hypothetical protein
MKRIISKIFLLLKNYIFFPTDKSFKGTILFIFFETNNSISFKNKYIK